MHRLAATASFVWLIMLASGCISAGRVESSVDARLLEEIKDANRQLEGAMRRGDLLGVAALYADDAVILGASGRRHAGREAIDSYWQRFSDPIDWKLEVLRVEGGDLLAIQRGRSTLTRLLDGEEQDSIVEFIIVWVRDDEGNLRIAVDAYW